MARISRGPWSNGQVEGQINRLKTLKRVMYGRASVELLRARMMPLQEKAFYIEWKQSRFSRSATQAPPELAAVYRPRAAPFWRVPQAIARMEAVLQEKPEGARFAAFLPAIAAGLADRELRCRAAVASTLVAGLELAREGKVVLGQEEAWGEISV